MSCTMTAKIMQARQWPFCIHWIIFLLMVDCLQIRDFHRLAYI